MNETIFEFVNRLVPEFEAYEKQGGDIGASLRMLIEFFQSQKQAERNALKLLLMAKLCALEREIKEIGARLPQPENTLSITTVEPQEGDQCS